MSWEELPEEARRAISERFPGLAGPLGAAVLWKAAGGALTGFEGGRLIATITLKEQEIA